MMTAGLFLTDCAMALVGAMVLGSALGLVAGRARRAVEWLDGLVLAVPIIGLFVLADMVVEPGTVRWVVVAVAGLWALLPLWVAASQANEVTGVAQRAVIAFEQDAATRRQLARQDSMPDVLRALADASRRVITAITLGGVVGTGGLGTELLTAVGAGDYATALSAAGWIAAIAVVVELGWLTAHHMWRKGQA